MQFHLLSFEGCDPYSRAGGIASRVSGMVEALAGRGFETHLWFVGDPDLPADEQRDHLHVHRWCQWISSYHPNGVYDGEEGKRADYVASLPPHLASLLVPRLRAGERAVVLAEEWHTADAVLHLDWLLRKAGVRERVRMFWNANNTFGFERIAWARLVEAACLTTVSRYMKHLMWKVGVDPLVVPNGLPPDAFEWPDRKAVAAVHRQSDARPIFAKVARWDPDKRWLLTIDIVAALKRDGARPLLVARGGVEAHAREVMDRAAGLGLRVVERVLPEPGLRGLLAALADSNGADVINLRTPLDAEARRILFQAAATVLANSGHEPFGLVGLETMAVGGLACTGSSGEDYAVPWRNALVMQTADSDEFIRLFSRLRTQTGEESALRRAGRRTAEQFAWPEIVERNLLPTIDIAG